mmetsp:Transcript_43714/g.105427  ORF Transcript_43714/g.105427 Transcript_43714/m.105427 type:complete len:106 (-) Transcript_43714:706-1023(-)
MYNSIIMPHKDLVVFGEPVNSRSEWHSLQRFMTWELYANNMIHAGERPDVPSYMWCLFVTLDSNETSRAFSLIPALFDNIRRRSDSYLDGSIWMSSGRGDEESDV